ncbi:MAG: hypothetical protein RLZZ511_704 [Cyanobacteriota bacterium]|jgi:hypothetical protein
MSPQPDRRYQSQLLKFLNRQGQQWRDRLETWGRQTKVAAIWGAQAALYPFYAVFQATRLATQQLQQQAQTIAQLLLPPIAVPSDLAINRILYSLNPETPYSSTLRVGAVAPQLAHGGQPKTIDAIASDLQTRMIQLIAQGESVLTLDQSAQGQMQRRITWEMATYWERWRRFQRRSAVLGRAAAPQALEGATKPAGLVQSSLAQAGMLTIADRPQLLPPVRLFRQLMAWVQQGPLASQINWFEETAIVAQPRADWFQPQLQSDLAHTPLTHTPLGQTALRLAHRPDLVQVIKAAFKHFFGRSQLALEDGFKAMADPWSQTVANQPVSNQTITVASIALEENELAVAVESLPAAATPPALPASNPQKTRRSPLSRPEAPKAWPQSSLTGPLAGSLAGPLAGAAGSGDLTWANVFTSDLTTTLIDTVATPIGYIQHPLERVLQWLDQAILWLETQGAKLWNWLTARIKR